jgi:hypothetical protein
MKKTWMGWIVAAGLVGAPAGAFAQEQWEETPEATEPPPAPEPPPTREEAPPPPPPHGHGHGHGHDMGELRPAGWSLGIGAGFLFPADITEPTVVSVRFRMPSGLTLEPLAILRFETTSDKVDTGPIEVEDDTTGFDFAVGTSLRYPFASRGRLDLIGIGQALLAFGLDSNNPDGPDNSIDTDNINVFLGYGIGLEYWLPWRNFSMSLDATNTILTLNRNTQDDGAVEQSTTSFSFGAVFNPAVRLLFHLYF